MNLMTVFKRLVRALPSVVLAAFLMANPARGATEAPDEPPVILGADAGPLLARGQRLLRTPGERVQWSVLSGHGSVAPEEGPATRVTAGGLWGPLVIQAQREGPTGALSTEVTLEVVPPPTQVVESELTFQPSVRRLVGEALLDQGAATAVFEGCPEAAASLRPGDLCLLPARDEAGAPDPSQPQVRQVSEVRVLQAADCPPSVRHLLATRAGANFRGPGRGPVATVLASVIPRPKDIFKSIRHRSTLRLDLESLSQQPGWAKFKRWLPSQISVSSPLAKGRPGGITFAFDGIRILEWKGRTLSFSGAITFDGTLEHATVVDADTRTGYSEQKLALTMHYEGAIVADLAEFTWPAEGGYQRLQPIPFPIVIPVGYGATLNLKLFPFYFKAKGWLEGDLAVAGEVDLDQVIRKNLATGEETRSGSGLSWPTKGEVTLAAEGRLKLFLGFFPLEAGLAFAGVEFAGLACPTGLRGSLVGHLEGPLGTLPTADYCASLSWDTELLFYLRYPSGFLGWLTGDWAFHKVPLAFHTRRLSGTDKDCLEDWDHNHHAHPENSPPFFGPEPRPFLGGAWLEGRVGVPVRLRPAPGQEPGPRSWSQVDGPCPVAIGDPSAQELSFTPARPGCYSFRDQNREVDVRVQEDREAPMVGQE